MNNIPAITYRPGKFDIATMLFAILYRYIASTFHSKITSTALRLVQLLSFSVFLGIVFFFQRTIIEPDFDSYFLRFLPNRRRLYTILVIHATGAV